MREIRQPGDYVYGFSRYLEPVATVKPGEEVLIYTEDAMESVITKPTDKPSELKGKYSNPQTGPIYIEGAEAGDTLVVEIINIEPDRDWAFSANQKEFGGLCGTETTCMLNEALEEKVWIYKFNDEGKLQCTTDDRLCFDWKPFLGTVTTAPDLEVISAITPFNQGGNMDVPDVCIGNKVYLPIAVDGACFYVGDCHGNQGQGELCGVALEIAAKVTLKFHVIKGKTIAAPRIENEEYIMCVGSAKPMEDAARMAYRELIKWMGEYGWSSMDAYQALSQCGELYVGNMVDTNYSLVARVKKSFVER